MQISLTTKLKLLNLTDEQKQLFDNLMNQYSKACNFTSDWISLFSPPTSASVKAKYLTIQTAAKA